MKSIFALVIVLLVAGCSTPEYRNARNSCYYDALQQYPVNNVSSVVTLTRPVQVPTGQSECTSRVRGTGRIDTECTQIMRTDYVPYQQSVVSDANANIRERVVNSCAAAACNRAYGNANCKTK
jgi:hypothetical protein